jgi:hypothetical protein
MAQAYFNTDKRHMPPPCQLCWTAIG